MVRADFCVFHVLTVLRLSQHAQLSAHHEILGFEDKGSFSSEITYTIKMALKTFLLKFNLLRVIESPG